MADNHDATASAGGSKLLAWGTVGVFSVLALLSYMDRQIISLLVDPIKHTFGVSDFQIGLLQGVAFGLFYAVFGVPMGWLVDRYSRRWVVYASVTIWSLATAGCGIAASFWQLAAARFAVGIGEAALTPAAYSVLADRFPRHRLAFALSVYGLGTALGSALALAVGGLITGYFDHHPALSFPIVGVLRPWQEIFLVVGLPGLVFALCILLLPEPPRTRRESQAANLRAFGQLLSTHRRYFACHFLGFGLVAAIAFGSSAWSAVLLTRRFGLDIQTAGPLLAATLLLANIPGFLFGGIIVDRWFRAGRTDAHLRYFAYSMAFVGFFGALNYQFAPNVFVLLPVMAITNFFLPFTGPAGSHLQLVTPPEFRGTISALFGLAFMLIGMCIGPPTVGWLTTVVFHDPMRINSSIAVLCLVCGLAAAVIFAMGLAPARMAIAHAHRGEELS